MLIVGAGGLLLQMIDDLSEQIGRSLICWTDKLVENKLIEEKCNFISSEREIIDHFKKYGNDFILSVGKPAVRDFLTKKFELLGGVNCTFISSKAIVSKYSIIDTGVIILHGSIVEACCKLEKGVLVNANTILTHEVKIGEFSEIGPGVTIAGKVTIGKNCFIGAGTTIIPGINIGDAAIVGAGSVVIHNIQENDKVAGIPAKSIRK